jgi:extradiol dioxygenase family protein
MKTIAFTVYPVKDLEKAKAFYRDAVGLGQATDLHERWAELDIGS